MKSVNDYAIEAWDMACDARLRDEVPHSDRFRELFEAALKELREAIAAELRRRSRDVSFASGYTAFQAAADIAENFGVSK